MMCDEEGGVLVERLRHFNEKMKKIDSLSLLRKLRPELVGYFCFFLLGVIIIASRGWYNIRYNYIYTEDGSWMGGIYRSGFWHTLFNVKPSYFVFGNVVLLQIANLMNSVLMGDNVINLALMINMTQYVFFAVAATLPLICFRKSLNYPGRICIWLLTLLIPLSSTSHEVLGKISNTGYVFFFICFCLLFFRHDHKYALALPQLLLLDFFVFLCPMTNPTCFFVVVGYFIVDLAEEFKKHPLRMNYQYLASLLSKKHFLAWLVLGVTLLTFLLYGRAMGRFITPVDTSMEPPILTLHNVVEFVIRMVVYPFLYPYYEHLNTACSLLILALFFGFHIVGYFHLNDSRQKRLYLFSLFSAVTYVALSFYGRSSLYIIGRIDYQYTYPDRYFYGQNIMMLIPTAVLLFSRVRKNKGKIYRLVRRLAIVYLVGIYSITLPHLFELDTRRESASVTSFPEQVKQTFEEVGAQSDGYIVMIDSNWRIWLPEDKMMCTLYGVRTYNEDDIDNKIVVVSDLTDNNWSNGTSGFTLLFPWTGKNSHLLKHAASLQNQSGDSARILSVVEYGDEWIHVKLESASMVAQLMKDGQALSVVGSRE